MIDWGEINPVAALDSKRDLLTDLAVRLDNLESIRTSWWVHWRELAEYILPRRYRWLVTPNRTNRGQPINGRIIDETGTVAVRVLANGMMSGITSPSRPWFRMTLEDEAAAEDAAVKLWLDDVAKRMQRVMAGSNYYTAKAIQYGDLVVFGSAPMIIYEHPEHVISCYNPCAGEYYLANSPDLTIDTLMRRMTYTCLQTVKEFGIDNVSPDVANAVKNMQGGKDQEIVVCHAIVPNDEYSGMEGIGRNGVSRAMKFIEVYWEKGRTDKALRIRGFFEQPFAAPRWDLVGNDAYGRSPGMDALPSIKQLQQMSKRFAQALDKMVNPPMVAGSGMANKPASLLPGDITYLQNGSDDFRPAFQIDPPFAEMTGAVQDVRERIKDTCFNDLFMMISQLDTVRTATEIDARREEKLIQLGPVLERFQTEGLAPDIERIFAIMARKGLLPPAPPAIRGQPIKIVYDSMLSQMQRAAQTGSLERLWATVGNLAGAVPDVLDLLNYDEGVDEYADMLGVSPRLLNAPDKVSQLRQQRAQAQQQVAAQQQAMAAVQGAQVMSQTPVGGGRNALQSVLEGQQ